MHASSLLALAASLSVAAAVNRGFNYGAVTRDGAVKDESSFTAEFKAAKGLAETDGAFSSARLYTMIQAGTSNSPISAIPAAISTDTRLFLGMWASSGQTVIDNEIAALKSAISQYGEKFTSRVNGISVGSEDLYRISPTGLSNDPLSVGAQPSEIVSYIKQVKSALSGTALSSIPVGHVDTWDVWRNGSNSAVVAECDFLGMNTFPYFQTTQNNDISNAPSLFNDAYAITVAAANGKPVLVTETGWPVSGKKSASAEPSKENARSYYEAVGCNTLFGKVDTYWYTLVDANTDTATQPQFGVVGTSVSSTPLFDLSCDATNTTSSSSGSATASSSGTKITSSATVTGSMSILPISTSGSVSSVSLAPEAGRPDSTSAQAGSNQTVSTGSVTATATGTGTDYSPDINPHTTSTPSPLFPSTAVSESQSISMTEGSDTATTGSGISTVIFVTTVPPPSQTSPSGTGSISNSGSSVGTSATSTGTTSAAGQTKTGTFVALFGAVAAFFVLV